jgi:hypothetical protein
LQMTDPVALKLADFAMSSKGRPDAEPEGT